MSAISVSTQTTADKSTSTNDIQDIAFWTGHKFGELRGYRTIDKNIRILSHTKGFAIFFPENFWRKLDHQVPLIFPPKLNSECWIAEKKFAFLKIDVFPSEGFDDYLSNEYEIALNKIENFVKKNFFENAYATPLYPFHSHGFLKDNPNFGSPIRPSYMKKFELQF